MNTLSTPRKVKFVKDGIEYLNCTVKGCRNAVQRGTGKLCPMHKSRKHKEQNPLKYFYNQSKQRAKNRGIAFNLTEEQYKKLWSGRNLSKWRDKVSGSNNWTIDRIDSRKGYEVGNVRVVSLVVNAQRIVSPEEKFASADANALITVTKGNKTKYINENSQDITKEVKKRAQEIKKSLSELDKEKAKKQREKLSKMAEKKAKKITPPETPFTDF